MAVNILIYPNTGVRPQDVRLAPSVFSGGYTPQNFVRTATDTVPSVTATALRMTTGVRNVTSAPVSPTDLALRTVGYVRADVMILGLSASTSRATMSSRSSAVALDLASSATRRLALVRVATDAASTAATGLTVVTRPRFASAMVVVSDSAARALVSQRAPSIFLSLPADLASRTIMTSRQLSAPVSTAALATARLGLGRSTADSWSVTGTAQRVLAARRMGAVTLDTSATSSRTVSLVRNATLVLTVLLLRALQKLRPVRLTVEVQQARITMLAEERLYN